MNADVPAGLPRFELELEGPDEKDDVGTTTGVYDVNFFTQPVIPIVFVEEDERSTDQLLADARIGLGLFVDEAMAALDRDDLTAAQRDHIGRILEYVDGLSHRFDQVRSAAFAARTR